MGLSILSLSYNYLRMKLSNKKTHKSIYGLFKGTLLVYLLITVMLLFFHQYRYMLWILFFFLTDLFLFFYMEPEQIDLSIGDEGVSVMHKECFRSQKRDYFLENQSVTELFIKNKLFGIKTLLWFKLEGSEDYYYINLSFFDPLQRDKVLELFLVQLVRHK